MLHSCIKNIHQIAWKFNRRSMTTKKTITEKVGEMPPSEMVRNTVHVSNWGKRIMIFAGRYKKMDEIPDVLPFDTVDRAYNWARIKICNIMIVLAAVGFIVVAIRGKKQASEGESILQMNLDWHREYNEKAKQLEQEKK